MGMGHQDVLDGVAERLADDVGCAVLVVEGGHGQVDAFEGVVTGLERVGGLLVVLKFARGATIDIPAQISLPMWRCLAGVFQDAVELVPFEEACAMGG